MIQLLLDMNSNRHLARIALTCHAANHADAHYKGHRAAGRFLSFLALQFDVPLRVYQTDTTELATGAMSFCHRNPSLEILVPAGTHHGSDFKKELQIYASLYREALIAESSAYQFLCYYRIAEGLKKRRKNLARKEANYIPPTETYPSSAGEAVVLYESVFPVKPPRQQIIE